MHKFLLAAATALALSPATASAAEPLTRIKSDKVAEMLTAITGKPAKIEKPEAGVEIATSSDNGDVDLIMTDCNAQGCSEIQMTMFFNKDDAFNLSVVNGYNSKWLNAQAFMTPENRVFLIRHYMVTGGIAEDNLKANIETYLKAPGIFVKHVLSSQTTAAVPTSGVTPAATPAPALDAGLSPQAPAVNGQTRTERLTANRKGHALR